MPEHDFWRQPVTDNRIGEAGDVSSPGPMDFQLLAENIPVLCWMARGDGYIFWYNKRWHDYCGSTPQQMEGWGWQSMHDPEMLPLVMENWQKSIADGEPFEMVFPLRGSDGIFVGF